MCLRSTHNYTNRIVNTVVNLNTVMNWLLLDWERP